MISIIIPVYNEANRLPQLLCQLQSWPASPQHEVIFVDGGSQDNTTALIERAGYLCYSATRGRGSQLKLGADKSHGEILFFLHADSQFLTSPLTVIEQTCRATDFGAFRLVYQTQNLLLKGIAWGASWRVRHRHIAFGDQGMFVTRAAYERIGGFHSLPLMEDYDFSLRAKALGIHCHLVPQEIISSSRYFDRNGPLRSLYRMQKCQWMFRHGIPIERIQSTYYR